MRDTEEKMNESLEMSYYTAVETMKDVDKMEKLLQQLEKKLKAVPIAGGALAYIPILMSAVRMHIKKEYTEIPAASMLAILVVLIYWLAPIDAFPDFVPALGYIDDAAVLTGSLILFKSDLDDFLKWRKKKGLECTDIPEYDNPLKGTKSMTAVIGAFFAGKRFRR